jgi:hypothetical protein
VRIGYRPTYVVQSRLYILYIHPLHEGQQLHLPDVPPRYKPPATLAAGTCFYRHVLRMTENVIRLLFKYELQKNEEEGISYVGRQKRRG